MDPSCTAGMYASRLPMDRRVLASNPLARNASA